MKRVFTQIGIDADAGVVWTALTDFSKYPAWNPFMVRIEGRAEVGERLECHPLIPGLRRPVTFRPVVTRAEPRRLFAWLGHTLLPGLADGEHFFEIEPQGDDSVRLAHYQDFRGILIPFIWPFMVGRTRKGFEIWNKALKKRAEKLEAERKSGPGR